MPQSPVAADNLGSGWSSTLELSGRVCICGGMQEKDDILWRVPAFANKNSRCPVNSEILISVLVSMLSVFYPASSFSSVTFPNDYGLTGILLASELSITCLFSSTQEIASAHSWIECQGKGDEALPSAQE